MQRKSDQYTNRAEAIWESRSASTGPVKDIKELPAYEKLAQEAQVTGISESVLSMSSACHNLIRGPNKRIVSAFGF